MQQKRASRYRFSPTLEHAAIVARTCGCVRPVSNWALRLRTDAYYDRQERVRYADTSAALTRLTRLTRLTHRPQTAWLNEAPCAPPQPALRQLDRAFRACFAGRAKYPTFKTKHGRQAADCMTSAFWWNAETRTVTRATMEATPAIRWSHDGTGTPSTVTVC